MRRRDTKAMMAIGALAGLMLVPALSSKTRKRIARTGRNAFFRMSDMIQDIKDMRK